MKHHPMHNMTPEDYKLMAEAIHQEFAKSPTNQIVIDGTGKLKLPQTWGGWLGLVTLCSAIIGFAATSVVSFHDQAEQVEANKAAILAHATRQGIHQTTAEKRLSTISTIQPIRDDIASLHHSLETIIVRMEHMEELLHNYE